MENKKDIIIIGGGPAGLSAGINGIIRGYKVLIIDTGSSKLAKAELVDNYLGLPKIKGEEMMKIFRQHALDVGVEIVKGKVANVIAMGDEYMVSYGNEVLTAKALILAMGAMQAKAIDGEEEFLGRGLSYCATCDGMLYRDKKAVVYGLAPDAPEEANYLAGIGVKVIYVNPGARPEKLREDIKWYSGSIKAVKGSNVVETVEIAGADSQEIQTQAVFLLREAVAPQAMIGGLGLEDGFIKVDKDMKTNLPGIFACGDCVGQPLQVSKAGSDGLIAGQEAAKYLDGLKK